MTKRQAAKVAKAEKLVREALGLLDTVGAELSKEAVYSVTVSNDHAQVVHAASGLAKVLANNF